MRFRKDIQQAFYANGVEADLETATITSIDTAYNIHYTQADGDKYWVSLTGTTSPVLEDSYTTSIVVVPTSFTGATGRTYQMTVVSQTGANVITECIFSGSTGNSVASGGLITLGPATGAGTVTTYHVDPVTYATLTAVTNTLSYIVTGLTFKVSGVTAITGTTTGQTFPTTVVANGGIDVKSFATFATSAAGVATVSTDGIVTLVGNHGIATITVTVYGKTATVTVAM